MKAFVEDYPANQADVRHAKSLSQAILDHRVTEHFTGDDVADEDLNEILRLGAQAPSGFNLHPWRFIVVRNPENKRRLQRTAMNQVKIGEAAVVLIALGMKAEWKQLADEIMKESARRRAGKPPKSNDAKKIAMEYLSTSTMPLNVWVTRQTMIPLTTMMLVAEAFGYATAPLEGFDPAAIKEAFGVPEEAEVVALLAIGKAKAPNHSRPGPLSLDQIVFSEKFGEHWMPLSDP